MLCPQSPSRGLETTGSSSDKPQPGRHSLTPPPPPPPPPQVKMAEDIDFKYPMRKACAWEISSFCANVPHGHARIIRCLQKNMDNEDMST
jgi:hypothetical protein